MNFRFPDTTKYKKRKCFRCKRPIEFEEFYFKNKNISKQRLIDLWQNDKLQFYCCLCYDYINREKEAERLREQLDKKQQDILKILEIRIGIELPLLPKIAYNSVGFSINQKNITGLSLFKMDLETFPKEIIQINNLQYLNLAWNFLETIPNSISSLTFLREKDLIGNHLTIIPDSIIDMKNLEVIDLSFNNLRIIPECISQMDSLRLLKLIRNDIEHIPFKIQQSEKKGLKIL